MNWHRLFGLLLTDFFTGSPFEVELEKDLSVKKQLLDVIILRKRPGEFAGRLPDGFGNLAPRNLLTFKSYREALDDWALKELTGHYVNYRKQVSGSWETLLPEDEFRLYAVCSRSPEKLVAAVELTRVQAGVYDCRRGTDVIRVIVANELRRTENNALLHLLTASPEQVRYGVEHYEQHSNETSSLLNRLFKGYEREGLAMPYTMEDFRRDFRRDYLKELTVEERLEGLSPGELAKRLSAEERLRGLSLDQIERYLRIHRQKQASPKRKKKR